MDEVTMVNLLNKICEKNDELSWKIKCKFSDGIDQHIMEVVLLKGDLQRRAGSIIFKMETGAIIRGRHRGVPTFRKNTRLVDALLEILHYESLLTAQLS